jgi:hypothetical protein
MDPDAWYLDSCASAHFTHREDWLDDVSSTSDSKIVLADNTKIESKSIGSTLIPIQIDNKPDFIKVHNVVYAPKISTNLLSVSKIIEKGHTVEFKGSRCEIKSKYGDLLATAHDHGRIYKLDSAEQSSPRRHTHPNYGIEELVTPETPLRSTSRKLLPAATPFPPQRAPAFRAFKENTIEAPSPRMVNEP